jgi:hypothetical protein
LTKGLARVAPSTVFYAIASKNQNEEKAKTSGAIKPGSLYPSPYCGGQAARLRGARMHNSRTNEVGDQAARREAGAESGEGNPPASPIHVAPSAHASPRPLLIARQSQTLAQAVTKHFRWLHRHQYTLQVFCKILF